MSTQDTSALQNTATSYDEFPYQSKPFQASHPALLQGIAAMFGIQTKSMNKARILELGCASGGNLIPLAYHYPDIELVGIDLSQVQIKQGQELIQELGLSERVSLHHMSITDIPESFGTFDYIICHGVYSWVPDFVQEGILNAFSKHLSDEGVAYISYNIYPGWKTLEIARDSMLFHTRNIKNPVEQLQHARTMINFMQLHAKDGSIYKQIMSNAQSLIQNSPDYYIAHEFLELHNTPCYFLEIVERAQKLNLSYLSDCSLSSVFPENWGDEVRNELLKASGNNQVVLEQYIDYMTNRQFRQSLFIKTNAENRINRTVSIDKIKTLNFSMHIEKENTPRENEPNITYFQFNRSPNSYYRTGDKVLIPYLDALTKFNHQILKCEDYAKILKQDLGNNYNEQISLSLLQRLVILGLISPYGEKPELNLASTVLSQTPKLSVFNLKALNTRRYLTNYKHELLSIDEVAMHIVPYIDGEHSINALIDILLAAAQSEKIHFHRNEAGTDTPILVTQESELRVLCQEYVHNLCNNLLRYSMFVD